MRTLYADTVPARGDLALVPHDRSSVQRQLMRQLMRQRLRSGDMLRAALTCLTLGLMLGIGLPAAAQQRPPARDSVTAVAPLQDTIPRPGGTVPPVPRGARLQPPQDTLVLRLPALFGPFGEVTVLSRFPATVADRAVARLRQRRDQLVQQRWNTAVQRTLRRPPDAVAVATDSTPAPGALIPVTPDPRLDARRARADSAGNSNLPADLLNNVSDLGLNIQMRWESKLVRSKNERCSAAQLIQVASNCTAILTPSFDGQFNIRTGGVVADRVHVNVDYDSQREFDASNNISVYFQGKSDEALQRLEVGNVSFSLAPSRFLTSGIPAGNYGVLASGQIGAMRFNTIFAQQKGNVSKDNTYTVGDRTVQETEREIDDIQFESRRFFFTVDPRQFRGYPNIDLLNRQQLQQLATTLPDSIRPIRIYVYKQLIGAINPNPRGPQFSVRGARNATRQIYTLLRENVDYYLDPSLLWIALATPLQQNNERLVVAYEVNVNGQAARNINTGGTPDLEFTEAPQFANLLWEPELQPSDTAGYFQREIKSVYRVGGQDIRRESIQMKLVTGSSGDQEKPADQSRGETYLQMFGLSQATNSGLFDAENRMWPRPQDQVATGGSGGGGGGGANGQLIRDNYLMFPSVQPFARAGLAQPLANPANDTLYRFPNEYLYSSQRPQSTYRLMARYMSEGGGDAGTLKLPTLQVRPLSERVVLDGRQLVRDVDYKVNYDIGEITFSRPDTLFPQPRQVNVRYEENQANASAPTTIFGLASQFPLDNGQLSFTAISQSQKSTFTRPQLGFEPTGSLVAGVTANFTWDANALTRALQALPFGKSTTPSRISMQGEFALSRPQPNSAGQAYIEAFESDRGREITLTDPAWSLSSLPAVGSRLPALLGGNPFQINRATTMAWQSIGFNIYNQPITFTQTQIDPSIKLQGSGVSQSESLLWLTLYPLRTAGAFSLRGANRTFNWTVGDNSAMGPTPTGRRWRSIRTVLSPSGQDLSAIETLEFFVLVHKEATKLRHNPTLIFDFGDISENSLAFTPETLTVNPPNTTTVVVDTTYRGKRLAGYDRFDSERDAFSRTFNAVTNDVGLPGSVADTIIVVDKTKPNPVPTLTEKVRLCTLRLGSIEILGDSRANCTAGDARLDEEDIDLDGQLNFKSNDIEREQWKRFAVDLSDTRNWTRVGGCTRDSSTTNVQADSLCWVQVRLNWRAPIDSINSPNDRRMRALRLTMVSGAADDDDNFETIALAKLKLVGAPWLARSDKPLAGVAGDSTSFGNGYVVASVIGSQDASAALTYEPPPGVVEQSDTKQSDYQNNLYQVNEHSLRLQAGLPGGQFPVFNRAEAYYRIPQGTQSYMGYRTLRLWMRGRGNGWGAQGELNGFVKVGRDENNFYLYRTPAFAGSGQSVWEPEVRVDLTQFQVLRAQLENNYQRSSPDSLSCSDTDLALIRHSGLPRGVTVRRYAVCKNGYIVYTVDPSVSPPNLASVQELAVGFVRIDSVPHGASGIMANDTLELWVDDMRLTDVQDDMGFAGELGLQLSAGDLADFRVNVNRRDPNFRQLGENPTFLTQTGMTAGTTLHLERMLPAALGIVAPLSINYSGAGVDQVFINRTDVRADGLTGLRNPKNSRVDYSLSLRRATPMLAGWYAPVLNGLGLSAAWGRGATQSAFQIGKNDNYSVNAVLELSGDARNGKLPTFMDRLLAALPRFLRESNVVKDMRGASLRWKPTHFRLTSGLARTSSLTTSYLRPVIFEGDTSQQTQALSHIWQNQSTLSFMPTASLSATIDARQLLDLRDYRGAPTQPDSLDRRQAAAAERLKFLGANLGLERERSMTTMFTFSPRQSGWLRPRVDFISLFTLYKDPNAQVLLRESDSSGMYRLPRRLGAAQTLTTGLVLDPGQFITQRSTKGMTAYRFGHAILPFEFNWSRSLTSNFDNTVSTPGTGYQFGFGGIDSYRGFGGRLATGAGRVERLTLRGSLALPLSLTVSSRYEGVNTDTWTRRSLDGFQALITSQSHSYPDVTAVWGWRLAKPNPVFSAVSANVRYAVLDQSTLIPNESGGVADQSRTRSINIPVTGSITWSFLGGLTTMVSRKSVRREDTRPGTLTKGDHVEQSLDVSRPFKLPKQWNARSPMRTHFAYNEENDVSSVQTLPGTTAVTTSILPPSVLANTRRRTFSLNADTEVSQTLVFSLSASHILSEDHNFNRKFSQTILSTVLQLKFFAGEVR